MWLTIEIGLLIASAIATLVVGCMVWFGERQNYLRLPFLLLATMVGIWIILTVLFTTTTGLFQFIVSFACYGIGMAVAVQTFYFVLALGNSKPKPSTWVAAVLGYAIAIVASLPYVIAVPIPGTFDATTRLETVSAYGIALITYLLAACSILINLQKSAERKRKRQLKLILLGIITSALLGILFNLLLPVIGIFYFIQLGPACAVFFISAMAYSIVRYQLFDVRLAVVRTIAYIATFSTLTVVYFFIAVYVTSLATGYETNTLVAAINTVTALLLALLLQPLKRFFDKVTGRIFYRDATTGDKLYAELNKTLSASTDLKTILRTSAAVVADNFKAEQVSFFVSTVDGHYVTQGTDKHRKLSIQDASIVEAYFVQAPEATGAIMCHEIDHRDEMYRLMRSYSFSIVAALPSRTGIQGFVCLGDRQSGEYSRRDTKLLVSIVDELSIAIQKTIAVQQLKTLNTHLEQRIDLATQELRTSNAQLQRLDAAKDEFVSMASHQLRTPLTSIKGYISMMLEGDVGSVTKEQRHVLNEVYISSERMVRLIGDFLNVSRLQTGKFMLEKQPIDLVRLVERELDGLAEASAARGMTFTFKKQKIPIVTVDENKIQQVVMNFADNAIYYSKDNTKIAVSLKVAGNAIEFTVKDTGIGVPLSEQEHLFGKFFRASNARQKRPDGTGVGLFLAKKVIDAHGGDIIFSSKEGKGSTFGFRLPLR